MTAVAHHHIRKDFQGDKHRCSGIHVHCQLNIRDFLFVECFVALHNPGIVDKYVHITGFFLRLFVGVCDIFCIRNIHLIIIYLAQFGKFCCSLFHSLEVQIPDDDFCCALFQTHPAHKLSDT